MKTEVMSLQHVDRLCGAPCMTRALRITGAGMQLCMLQRIPVVGQQGCPSSLSPAGLVCHRVSTRYAVAPSRLRATQEESSIRRSNCTNVWAPDCTDAGGCAAGTGRGDAAEADAVAAGDAGVGGGRALP
jgi:hypothetical protein